VWQIAFLIIGTDPIRFRPMMVATILEKLVYVATMVTLYLDGSLQASQAAVAVPDFILAMLFVAAFVRTAEAKQRPALSDRPYNSFATCS